MFVPSTEVAREENPPVLANRAAQKVVVLPAGVGVRLDHQLCRHKKFEIGMWILYLKVQRSRSRKSNLLGGGGVALSNLPGKHPQV